MHAFPKPIDMDEFYKAHELRTHNNVFFKGDDQFMCCCACQAFKGLHPAEKGRAWDSIKSFASTNQQIRQLVSSSLHTKGCTGGLLVVFPMDPNNP